MRWPFTKARAVITDTDKFRADIRVPVYGDIRTIGANPAVALQDYGRFTVWDDSNAVFRRFVVMDNRGMIYYEGPSLTAATAIAKARHGETMHG